MGVVKDATLPCDTQKCLSELDAMCVPSVDVAHTSEGSAAEGRDSRLCDPVQDLKHAASFLWVFNHDGKCAIHLRAKVGDQIVGKLLCALLVVASCPVGVQSCDPLSEGWGRHRP